MVLRKKPNRSQHLRHTLWIPILLLAMMLLPFLPVDAHGGLTEKSGASGDQFVTDTHGPGAGNTGTGTGAGADTHGPGAGNTAAGAGTLGPGAGNTGADGAGADAPATPNNTIRLLMEGQGMSNSTWLVFREDGSMQRVTGDALQLEPLSQHYVILAVQKIDGMFDISLLPMPDDTLEVPLVTRATRSGTYTLSVTNWDMALDRPLFLEDRKLDTSVELSEEMSYEFELIDPPGKIAATPLDVINRTSMNTTEESVDEEHAGHMLDADTEHTVDTDAAEPRFFITAGEPVSAATPDELPDVQPLTPELSQNYPNPFNPSTIITYALPERTHVTLAVYDMLGRRVSSLVDAVQPPGTHRAFLDAGGLTSGVYFYRLTAGGQTLSRSMTLIK